MFVSNMLPYVLQILSTFPQPAHPVPLYTFLIPFLPHDQPGHEAPDCHCSLFGCHTFHNSILPLHASPSYDSQVNWTIMFQIYMFRRTSFLQLYSDIFDLNINYNTMFNLREAFKIKNRENLGKFPTSADPPPGGGWELCELGNNVRNLDPPPFPNLGTL